MDALRSLASSSKGFFDIVGSKIYSPIVIPPTDLTGKRVLVTGANSGIGKELALTVAQWGAEVYLLCRDEKKAEATRVEIVEKTGNDKVYVEIVDFASFISVREFVRRWNRRSPDTRPVDILFSNAGIAYSQKCTTADGFEICYHVNTLSHYTLIVPMIQLGLFAPDARIILLSSSGIYASKVIDPEDLNSADLLANYKEGDVTNFETLWALSARSKAQQVVFGRELQAKLTETKKWKGIVVSSCHPGAVNTEIYSRPTALAYNPTMAKWAKSMIDVVGVSPAQGVTTPLYLATTQDDVPGGKYWERCGWKWTPAWMEDAGLRERLWAKWEQDTRIKANFA